VGQASRVPRLGLEPGQRFTVLEISGMQHRDRHRPVRGQIPRAPDFAETARADPLLQLIPVAERNARRHHPPWLPAGQASNHRPDEVGQAVRAHLSDPGTLMMPHLLFLARGRKPDG
jgi:hypothetical protein